MMQAVLFGQSCNAMSSCRGFSASCSNGGSAVLRVHKCVCLPDSANQGARIYVPLRWETLEACCFILSYCVFGPCLALSLSHYAAHIRLSFPYIMSLPIYCIYMYCPTLAQTNKRNLIPYKMYNNQMWTAISRVHLFSSLSDCSVTVYIAHCTPHRAHCIENRSLGMCAMRCK